MGIFQDGMISLQNMGILDVILPFILVFTVVFAVLQKSKVLGVDEKGKPRKNFNSVIALVMGLAVVIPHVVGTYPSPDSDVVNIINSALPNVSAVLVAVLCLLMIVGIFGGEVTFAGTSLAGWAVLFAVVATVLIFGAAANWFQLPFWLNFVLEPDTEALIVVVLVFALIIWFITREEKEKKPGEKNFFEKMGEVYKSGK